MDELVGWVHDVSRFQADVTDVRLRSVIEYTITLWERIGSEALWGIYFTTMGKDMDDYSDEQYFDEVHEE